MQTDNLTEKQETIPFYPDHVTTEFKVVIAVLVVAILIGIFGLLSPVGLQDPADPINTPDHVKPEWYFLALYQLLKYIPKTTGAVAPVLMLLVVLVWPFLDRKEDSQKATRTRRIVTIVGVVLLIALTIWGEVS